MSAAKAAVDHMRDWLNGTKSGEFVSMAVLSDGTKYNVPKDIMFSFPVEISNCEWKIVEGLPISAFAAEKLKLTADELIQERDDALAVCQD